MKKQTNQCRLEFLLMAITAVVIMSSSFSTFAQDKLEKDYRGFPVKLSSLIKVLKSGEFQENEIIKIIKENGVGFPLTPANEAELRTAGASFKLIAAIQQRVFPLLGVMNGKATNLIVPTYPAAASAVHAGGIVNVAVTLDIDGNVLTAHAVSGHPLLREAAEEAARASKFSPTILSGKKTQVAGVIIYNFVAR